MVLLILSCLCGCDSAPQKQAQRFRNLRKWVDLCVQLFDVTLLFCARVLVCELKVQCASGGQKTPWRSQVHSSLLSQFLTARRSVPSHGNFIFNWLLDL